MPDTGRESNQSTDKESRDISPMIEPEQFGIGATGSTSERGVLVSRHVDVELQAQSCVMVCLKVCKK